MVSENVCVFVAAAQPLYKPLQRIARTRLKETLVGGVVASLCKPMSEEREEGTMLPPPIYSFCGPYHSGLALTWLISPTNGRLFYACM